MKRVIMILFCGFALMVILPSLGKTEEPKLKIKAKVIQTIKLNEIIPIDLIYSPDGSLLYCKNYFGSYNPKTGEILVSMESDNFIMEMESLKNIVSLKDQSILCFLNNSDVLIKNDGLRIWNYGEKSEMIIVTDVDGKILCTSDGKYAVTVIDDEKAIVTNLALKSEIGMYPVPSIDDFQAKYLFNGPDKLYMVCAKDTLLNLINIIKNEEIVSIKWEEGKVEHAALSSDCRYLAIFSGEAIHVLNITENKLISKIDLIVGKIRALNFSKDNNVLGGCTTGNQVVLLDMISKTEIFTSIGEHKGPITSICFSPVENIFTTCSFDGTIKIWEYSYVEVSQ